MKTDLFNRIKHSYKGTSRVIRDYLDQGYFIQVIHDLRTMDVERVVTDEEGNDIMSVNWATMKSLLRLGVIVERPTNKPRCVELEIEEYVLKAQKSADASCLPR